MRTEDLTLPSMGLRTPPRSYDLLTWAVVRKDRPQLQKTERVNTMKKVIEDAFKKALEIAIEKKDPDSIACVASSYNSAIQFERQTSTAIKRSNS